MDQRKLTVFTLNDLLPKLGYIQPVNNQWKIVKPIPGLDQFTNRSFDSQDALVGEIVSHYEQRFQTAGGSASVTDIRKDDQSQTQTKKAV